MIYLSIWKEKKKPNSPAMHSFKCDFYVLQENSVYGEENLKDMRMRKMTHGGGLLYFWKIVL